MTLGDAFSNTAAAFPHLLNWSGPFDWSTDYAAGAAEVFLETLIELQHGGDGTLLQFAGLLRTDIIAQTAQVADERSAAMIDGMRFIVAQPAIHRTMAIGRLGDCYGWTLWAISRTHDPDARINHGEYRLPPFVHASAWMNNTAVSMAPNWIRTAFLLARTFGGLDGHCHKFFDFCFGLSKDVMAHVDRQEGIEALVSIANWATQRHHPRAEEITLFLLEIYRDGNLSPREKILVGVVFMTAAGYWTPQSPTVWARQIIAECREHLVDHELVQLLAVSVDSLETWEEYREEILVETRRLADSYFAGHHTETDDLISLETRFDILHPLIYNLCRFGSTDDLMNLLWAWYGRPGWQQADSNILFVCPNHGEGVYYVWPGGRCFLSKADVTETLESLVATLSDALNEYFRGPLGDRECVFDLRMVGAPARMHGETLKVKMEEHYQFSLLREKMPQEFAPRSIVVVPAHRHPLQSMLSDTLGRLAPLETSFAEANADRAFRTLSIWPGATQLTHAEVSALEAVARMAGWRVKVTAGVLNEAAFREFYQDPEADILWVIGHGEHSPYRHWESGLIIAEHALLPIAHIANLQVPRAGRRLLVLNICSGGTAQNLGGVARVGLGHALVSPHQQVVAHLWPIDYYAALAFGCAFACMLTKNSPSQALLESIRLMRDQTALLSEIKSVSTDLEALARLDHESVVDHLDSVLSWGCPSLLT